MKKILIILCLITLLTPQAVFADLIVPGQKYSIDYCLIIDNLEQFNDYYILTFQGIRNGGIFKDEVCYGYTKGLYTPSFFAIRKSEFNIESFNLLFNNGKIGPDIDNERSQYVGNLQKANFSWQPIGFIATNDPLKKVTDVIKITSLNNEEFSIEKNSVIYKYDNGETEQRIYKVQDKRPVHLRKPIIPWWADQYIYLILPIIALIALIAILLYRKFKVKKVE